MSEQDNSNASEDVDLDAFSADFFGSKAEPAVEDSPKEEVEVEETAADDTSTEEDTLAADDETEEEEVPNEEAPKPKKKSAQERINDITREKHEANRRAEELERRLNEVLERTKVNEDTPKPPIQQTDAPHPDDKNEDGSDKYPLGQYDEAFIKDTVDYRFESQWRDRQVEEEQRQAAAKVAREEAELNARWNSAVEASKVDIVSAQENLKPIFGNVDPQFGNYLAATIMSMEKGPEVFEYLGNHLDVAEDIIASGPRAATITLGRLEARFLENGNKKQPKVSNAPEPPPQLNRGNNGRFEVADDTDDLDAFSAKFFKRK